MEQKAMESPRKTGEIKFVIKSIIPITSDFTTVIKNSNDSSIDNLLEFRSLLSNSFKVNTRVGDNEEEKNEKSYSADVKDFIQKILEREGSDDKSDEMKNDSGCKSEQNESSDSMNDLVIAKKQKINDSDGSPVAFATMASSTPIKMCEHRDVKLDISGVGFLSFVDKAEENPKSDSLNDSDFESMDQDQYDETHRHDKQLDKTLVNNYDELRSSDKENMSIISRTSSLTDFKNGFRMILEETVKRTPMALRRAFNMDSDSGSTTSSVKKSKFLNLFSSTKKLKRKQSPGKKRHSRRSTSVKKKFPLTKENLQKHLRDESEDKENVEWGENFDYSFLCEPASSDIDENENSPNYISYNTSLDSSIEMLKSPLIPKFRIDPPTDASSSISSSVTAHSDAYPPACDYVRHMIRCSYASVTTSLRRSMSAPAIEDGLDAVDDSLEFAFSQANTTKTCEASIKNLSQLSGKHISNELSPFKRWGQSSLRSRADPRTPLQRRPSSLIASESDVYTKTSRDNDEDDDFCPKSETQVVLPTGPTVWGQSFELLINDPAGLHSFAEFLKKEFSGENIYFWTACERFRQINDISERTKEALAIFDKHLANGSLEPVNVDSHARLKAQERLPAAEKDLFIQVQKQIFNLMKFDSYQRFIRSDLYKTCLDAENRNLPLPYPAEQLDPMLRITIQQPSSTITKLKKSLSNAEDRRRKSLLPWHRKARCKSKDRDENKESMKNSTSSSNTLKQSSNHSIADIHSSRSSLSSFDATISKISSFDEDTRSSLCRVILSNGATTIVQTKVNETIRELVERLLDKRGICYQAYEAFLSGTTKPLDLDGLSKQLAGNEVLIEQRVIFKLDLPNKKVISVKSKTCKMLSEVLRPILHKYQYRLDLVQVYGKESADPLDMSLSVTAVDGQRLQIVCKEENSELVGEVTAINTAQNAKTKQSPQNFKLGNLPVTFVRANKLTTSASNPQLNTLDEITNKVFNELLQGKVDAQGMTTAVNGNVRQSDQGSVKSEDWGSETSSGIFNRMRRHPKKSQKMLSKSSAGSEEGEPNAMKKPLIAKWKAGAKLQVTSRAQNDESLLEGLKRAQRSRLEDQRGTEINFELPEFLKDKEKYANVGNKLRKTKFDESPSNSISLYNNIDTCSNNEPVKMNTSPPHYTQKPPQPAPRLSLTGKSPTKSSPEASSVQSKISSLENAIMMNSTSSAKIFVNSRSNTPSDLNLSTQCLPSNTPMKSRSSDSPIYYSPDGSSGIYADTTMVFNHHPNSNYESTNDIMGYYNNNNDQHDYQEIEDANRNRIYKHDDEQLKVPPLPPKPTKLPIRPSNWQTTSNNKENFFKTPQELPRRAPLASAETLKSDVFLDQPTSSTFV